MRSSLLHVFTIISFLSLLYRYSLHSTLTPIKSEIKVHNIWLKHCGIIQWDHHSFMFFTIISFLSLSYRHSLHSALTSIESEIKVHNIWVKHCDTIQWDHHSFMFSPSSYSCLFHTDTHYTQPLRQSNRRSRCTIFRAPEEDKQPSQSVVVIEV